MEELIVLLGETCQPIGMAPKLASHHARTPLHQGFSCYMFNDQGQLLLTRRANSKKVWPGVWTNTVCGHPAPSESLPDAIYRRSQFELGIGQGSIDNLQEILGDYRYITPAFNGIIENEFCPVYAAVLSEQPQPNPDEVGNHRWVDWADLRTEIAAHPNAYSYWLGDQLPLLAAHPKLAQYVGG